MFTHFDPSLFTFLQQLEKNNDREWFNANKQRYEDLVRGPALEFITEMQNWIPLISPHYEATPRKWAVH